MIILVLILLFLLAYCVFFISQFYNIVFRKYAPFISTDRETIQRIIAEVGIRKKGTVYELGCGRARFLRMVEKVFPLSPPSQVNRVAPNLIGVENLFSLYLINKLRLLAQGSRIKLIKGDFFTLDLKSADLIYCYLNNTTMAKLGEKLSRECRPGTQIVSRTFPIPQFKAEKSLTIKGKKIFFYKI